MIRLKSVCICKKPIQNLDELIFTPSKAFHSVHYKTIYDKDGLKRVLKYRYSIVGSKEALNFAQALFDKPKFIKFFYFTVKECILDAKNWIELYNVIWRTEEIIREIYEIVNSNYTGSKLESAIKKNYRPHLIGSSNSKYARFIRKAVADKIETFKWPTNPLNKKSKRDEAIYFLFKEHLIPYDDVTKIFQGKKDDIIWWRGKIYLKPREEVLSVLRGEK